MLIENGSVASCPCITCFGRQYGVADSTPRTIAVYKPLRARPIAPATSRQWLRYYASVGSDWDYLMALAAFWANAAPW